MKPRARQLALEKFPPEGTADAGGDRWSIWPMRSPTTAMISMTVCHREFSIGMNWIGSDLAASRAKIAIAAIPIWTPKLRRHLPWFGLLVDWQVSDLDNAERLNISLPEI